MRSSSEWKVTTASRPPGRSSRSAAASALRQFVQFLVDRDAQRLKRPRGRMDFADSCRRGAGDDFAPAGRGQNRRLGALGDDGAGDSPRGALLAIKIKDVGERLRLQFIDQIGGAAPGPLHAHVERPVEAEGKAALRLVELHRRHADVERDSVERPKLLFRAAASICEKRVCARMSLPPLASTSA